ncbi:hypothetical protein MMC31_006244 [Peltigera leucophlebia]|nr:hypothetical protein [Peltigera leucophlebia]
MLRQLHIFDTNAADPQLQEAYLANALVNLRGLPHTFYEINLLLEHQNGEFKRFRTDRGSSLQETDQMFKQHALSLDTLRKVRLGMNKIFVGRDRTVPDLLIQGEEALIKNVLAYNESLSRPGGSGEVIADHSTEEVEAQALHPTTMFQELQGTNERVNEIFTQARESEFAASDLMA